MIPFVVVSLARSGTQFLSACLREHPRIIAHGEVLNQVDENLDDTTLIEQCYRQAIHWRMGAVGITLLATQLWIRPFTLPTLLAVPNMRVIVLQRRDQLARLRSVEQSAQTWRWDVDTPPPSELPAVRLSPPETLRSLRAATILYDQLRGITTVPLFWITYEELCADQDSALCALWDFLGVDPIDHVDPHAHRQEDRPLQDTIVNFEEIRDYLAATRYALGG